MVLHVVGNSLFCQVTPLQLMNPTEDPCEVDQVGCEDEIARMTARGRCVCVMRVSSFYAVTRYGVQIYRVIL